LLGGGWRKVAALDALDRGYKAFPAGIHLVRPQEGDDRILRALEEDVGDLDLRCASRLRYG
jgi:hypothetical protein